MVKVEGESIAVGKHTLMFQMIRTSVCSLCSTGGRCSGAGRERSSSWQLMNMRGKETGSGQPGLGEKMLGAERENIKIKLDQQNEDGVTMTSLRPSGRHYRNDDAMDSYFA